MVRAKLPPRRPPLNKGGSKVTNIIHSVMANTTTTNLIENTSLYFTVLISFFNISSLIKTGQQSKCTSDSSESGFSHSEQDILLL